MKKTDLTETCTVLKHPVIQHKLTRLRDASTPPEIFRQRLSSISSLLAYEVTKTLKTKAVSVKTPLAETKGAQVDERLILVPIFRAGTAMLDPVLEVLPFAEVGHIGIYRDRFIKNTVEYYFRLPQNPEGQRVVLLDPLLATGDTAVAAVDRLKQYEVGEISFVCILAAPDGLLKMKEFHPDVKIFTLSIEDKLNHEGYILPGLGDAGNRLYGTY